MPQRLEAVSIILLALSLAAPLAAGAADAGRFDVVHGNVDLLKQGKLPTVSVRVDDRVQPGDVIRTKDSSTAQLTMADGTAIILAPQTRLAVVDYSYDQETGKRHAVLRLFRGLVHTMVTQVQDGEEPDFLIKTNSANLAVRGTDWYTLLAPEFTEVDLINGRLDVSSSLPALPVAVTLKDMQVTWVYRGHQPQAPSALSPKTLILLRQVMEKGVQDYALFGLRLPPPQKFAGGTPLKVPEHPKGYLEKMTPPLVPAGPAATPAPMPPAAP